jgi:DnaJ-class molecular chaperone
MKSPNQAEEDALRTINEITSQISSINSLTHDINLAEEILQNLSEGKEIESDKLQSLDLTQQSPTALKLRLKGIITVRKAKLFEVHTAHSKNLQLLHDLLKCPTCQGTGKITKTVYDRSERKIVQVTKTDDCPSCGGTGKANISDNIKNLILSIE